MRNVDSFFLKQNEPHRSCLLALREIILQTAPELSTELKYGMPFFCYKGKMVCYLWIHKKYAQPYIGIVEGKHVHHPSLLQEKRARMKILLVDPEKDLPVDTITTILHQVLPLYT